MSETSKQLNILEMMGYRRDHSHASVNSALAVDIEIPAVSSNYQYDSPTITRVTKQLAENIGRITKYIKENAEAVNTTNLATYITTNTSDENGLNKIFVAPPCTMSSQRTLDLKSSADIRPTTDFPKLIGALMMENPETKKKFVIAISETKILRYELTDVNTINSTSQSYETLYTINEKVNGKDVLIQRVGFADLNRTYVYIITNTDIRLFKMLELTSDSTTENSLQYSNIVDFKNSYSDDHHRFNDNLVIEDIERRKANRILDLINGGNFHQFVDKYYKLGEFPANALLPEFYVSDSTCIRNVYDVGIVTGKYGIYQIHCYSSKPKSLDEFATDDPDFVRSTEDGPLGPRGSLHIKCLDDKPVSDAFFYVDNGVNYLIAINGWPKSDTGYRESIDNRYKGVTVLRIDANFAAGKSERIIPSEATKTDDPSDVNNPWQDVPPDGLLMSKKYEGIGTNINAILGSRGVNGAYVNTLRYREVTHASMEGYLVHFSNAYYSINNHSNIECDENGDAYWFIEIGDQSLCNIRKIYDKREFNCLAEYKINHAAYSKDNKAVLFFIRNVGLVIGNQEHDPLGNTGFRFNTLKSYNSFGDDKIKSIYVMNRCLVAASEKKIYFVIGNGDSNVVEINKDIDTGLRNIDFSCTYEKSNIFCIGQNVGELAKIAVIFLKYRLNTKRYTDIITQDLSELIKSEFISKDNAISKAIDKHIREMHGMDSVIYKLNSILMGIKDQAILQKTMSSDNKRISIIALNYPNHGNDFVYVETDENSTDIYGRVNSKTVNANTSLTTIMKRNSNSITYYDTVQDEDGNVILDTNHLVYSTCKLAPNLTRLTINIPSTGTYYVDNILGWSGGNRTGSALLRKNLADGFIQGQLENCTTKYQLIINRVFFDVRRILNVTAQLTSAPLGIYSNLTNYDIRHYGMYDSPIIQPLNLNSITDNFEYDMSSITNDELTFSFSIFGGDAMQINILIENNNED